ncbi:hypothetical protein GCM10017691_57510 [Pseudonocardia petroleophila]
MVHGTGPEGGTGTDGGTGTAARGVSSGSTTSDVVAEASDVADSVADPAALAEASPAVGDGPVPGVDAGTGDGSACWGAVMAARPGWVVGVVAGGVSSAAVVHATATSAATVDRIATNRRLQ